MTDDPVPLTIAAYDRIADAYSVNADAYTPREEREKFVASLVHGAAVLDAGCAAGRDSIYFSGHGMRTVGVDLSEKLLVIARKRAPTLTFLHDDIRRIGFPDASFDGIWACAVLLHLRREDVPVVLGRFYGFLKPGGMVFLMIKKGTGETDIAEPLSSGQTRHFTLFTPEEIRRMAEAAGFSVTDLYTWNSMDRYTPARDVEWISCFAKKR